MRLQISRLISLLDARRLLIFMPIYPVSKVASDSHHSMSPILPHLAMLWLHFQRTLLLPLCHPLLSAMHLQALQVSTLARSCWIAPTPGHQVFPLQGPRASVNSFWCKVRPLCHIKSIYITVSQCLDLSGRPLQGKGSWL